MKEILSAIVDAEEIWVHVGSIERTLTEGKPPTPKFFIAMHLLLLQDLGLVQQKTEGSSLWRATHAGHTADDADDLSNWERLASD